MKTFTIPTFLFISLILLCSAILDIATAQHTAPSTSPAPSPVGICDAKCSKRCELKGRQSKCMHYCMMCCEKCQCVPSGTWGNKDECPCYRDWLSSQGKPKCP